MVVLYELGNEPQWDATNGNENAPPLDCNSVNSTCQSVHNYVTALVKHTEAEGLSYLIPRNEPQNFDKNWVGSTADVYAHFQQAVYNAAHSIDPSIKILNGGTEVAPTSLLSLVDQITPLTPYEQQAREFSQELYSNSSWRDSIDVLDIHVGDHGPIYSPEIISESETKAVSCRAGKPINVWVTECAYPSDQTSQDAPILKKELPSSYDTGEAGQAKFLTDTIKSIAALPYVIGINWTFLIDPNQENSGLAKISYREASSIGISDGLLTSNFEPKPSYWAFKKLASNW